jgi:hypothetical protein
LQIFQVASASVATARNGRLREPPMSVI